MTDKATPTQTALGIDYLAKDYGSFRRLMLDRLTVTAPGVITGHPADLGTLVIEAVATLADGLSYYQDAVATEAYLGTARLRTSVRRHARLLDYLMHDGCNARTWVAIQVDASAGSTGGTQNAEPLVLPAGTALLSRVEGQPALLPAAAVLEVLSSGAQLFETLHDLPLRAAHNQMTLLPSDAALTLPVGTTSATLINDNQDIALRVGDVVVLEETRSADGGAADPSLRGAVRLTAVQQGLDAATGRRTVTISWGSDDALPCELTVARTVVSGNIALADHGYTLPDDETVSIPGSHLRASLSKGPLTWQRMVLAAGRPQPFDPNASAQSAIPTELDSSTALQPAVTLFDPSGRPWTARRDLLASGPHGSDFVVEVEDDGRTSLRFGDGVYGKPPPAQLVASYRVGNGSAGNIGAEALYHIVSDLPGLLRARNPLPANGGTDGEPIDQVRIHAPSHMHLQERAVTTADYESTVKSFPEVRSAKVVRRWTGSWYTLLCTVQRLGGAEVDSDFKDRLRAYLDDYRMVGHDLQISGPVQVPLDIQLAIGVTPGFWSSSVLEAVRAALGPGTVNGQLGFFHPDRTVLGQPLYLSQLIAAAMQVQGVSWVEAPRFQRYNGASALADGLLSFREFEVPMSCSL